MKKPDDCTLAASQLAKVRTEAEKALRSTDSLGVFPTPVNRILEAANVEEVLEDVLNEGFIAKMRAKAGKALRSALSKVLGLFDVAARLIFIDRTLLPVKQTFIRLHESGHGFLPWQRKMYAVVEDCDKSLDPDVADLFDREANVFATEVLFQLETFTEEARGEAFSIFTPVRLSKKYGASIYAAVRRYVAKSDKACAVLVLNKPEVDAKVGFRSTLRRAIQSDQFTSMFGNPKWPDTYTPDDAIGAMIPISRKYSGKRTLSLRDSNGDDRACQAEAFTQGYQIFVLIMVRSALAAPKVLIAG